MPKDKPVSLLGAKVKILQIMLLQPKIPMAVRLGKRQMKRTQITQIQKRLRHKAKQGKKGQNLVLDKWNATMNCVGWHL